MSSKNLKIAQPYAEAFLELSTKGSLDTVINDLNCVSSSVSFLLVLCDRGRISYLEPILDKALELAYKAASIETVKVISSTAFTSAQQEALVTKLKKMTGAEQIRLDITTNSNLIGGFVVQIGSKIIDTSIQGQLKQLSSYLGSSVF